MQTPPIPEFTGTEAEQEAKAIQFITATAKAAGWPLSEEEAKALYQKAKDRMLDAMVRAKVEGEPS